MRSTPFLTRFERTEIIAVRAKQLESGLDTVLAPEQIPRGGDTHAIAAAEVAHRCVPVLLRRPLPGREPEVVNPNHLLHLPFY